MCEKPNRLEHTGPCINPVRAVFVLALACAVLPELAAGVLDAPPLKYEAPSSLTATIYDHAGTNVLFNFKRTATRSGTNLSVLREYTRPDGQIAARETVVYHGDNLAAYTVDELQSGAGGSAKILHDS